MITYLIAFVVLYRILRMLSTKQVIEDANGEPYLVRYFIYRPDWLDFFQKGLAKKAGRIYLHHFLRSDYDRALHDHPWNFTSLILTKGYWEIADSRHISFRDHAKGMWRMAGTGVYQMKTFHKPFSLIHRGAGWRHRVQVIEGTTPWTLVFIGPKVREWGFWTTATKWCSWKKYSTRTGLCDEPEIEPYNLLRIKATR